MPNIFECSQEVPPANNRNILGDNADFTDWFGIQYRYSEAQGSATPINKVLTDVTKWEQEINWPNLDEYDFAEVAEGYRRSSTRAICMRLPSACFEQLHFMEGVEQALIDLIAEPEASRAFFEAMVDFHIDVLERRLAVFDIDYVIYHDDWGTARAPFFSEDLLRETILPPTIRYMKHIKDKGIRVMFHCCGLINDFIPALVDEVGSDALDIQYLNDIEGIMKNYGDRTTIALQMPDAEVFFDPATTVEQIKAKAREYVDRYGAHVNPGAGGVLAVSAVSDELFHGFYDEIFEYSYKKYKQL
jgi:hypothetical protein